MDSQCARLEAIQRSRGWLRSNVGRSCPFPGVGAGRRYCRFDRRQRPPHGVGSRSQFSRTLLPAGRARGLGHCQGGRDRAHALSSIGRDQTSVRLALYCGESQVESPRQSRLVYLEKSARGVRERSFEPTRELWSLERVTLRFHLWCGRHACAPGTSDAAPAQRSRA